MSSGVLYCGGAGGDTRATADCWLLAPGAPAWREVAPLLQAAAYAGSAVLEDRFYVAGGWTDQRPNALDTLQVFTETNWKFGPKLLTARYGGCAVAHPGGYLLLLGGWGGAGGLSPQDMQRSVAVVDQRGQGGGRKRLSVGPEFQGHTTGSCALLPSHKGLVVVGGQVYSPRMTIGHRNTMARLDFQKGTLQVIIMLDATAKSTEGWLKYSSW